MQVSDWLLIGATLLSPLIAVRAAAYLDRGWEHRQRKLAIFKTLMATRAMRLDPSHVQALNMIDVEFRRNNRTEKKVIEAWTLYLSALSTKGLSPETWITKKDDLFIDLMYQMSLSLGYDLSKTDLQNTSYFPMGHGEMEDEQRTVRRGLAKVFKGEASFPIEVRGVSQPPANSNPSQADVKKIGNA